tara:strand:+ start:1725 stop:2915 length:1191 start_codon:yes stop_codon:yes gene_type:complete
MNYRLCIILVLIFIIFLIICNKSNEYNEYNEIREDFAIGIPNFKFWKTQTDTNEGGYMNPLGDREEWTVVKEWGEMNPLKEEEMDINYTENKSQFLKKNVRDLVHSDCDVGLVDIYLGMHNTNDPKNLPGPANFNNYYSNYFPKNIKLDDLIKLLNSKLSNYNCVYNDKNTIIPLNTHIECGLSKNKDIIKDEIKNLIISEIDSPISLPVLNDYLKTKKINSIIGESTEICETNKKGKKVGLGITSIALIASLSGIIWLPVIIKLIGSIGKTRVDLDRVNSQIEILTGMGYSKSFIDEIYNKLILAIIFKNLLTILSVDQSLVNIDITDFIGSEQLNTIFELSTKLLNFSSQQIVSKIEEGLFTNFGNNLLKINIDSSDIKVIEDEDISKIVDIIN